MKIERFWHQTLIQPRENLNQTQSDVPVLDTSFQRLRQDFKLFSEYPYVLIGIAAVTTTLAFYIFLLVVFIKKMAAKKQSLKVLKRKNTQGKSYDKLKTWNPDDKGPIILKWEYTGNPDASENDDSGAFPSRTKGHRLIQVRYKGKIKTPGNLEGKNNRSTPIKEVVFETSKPPRFPSVIPLNSLTSVGSRKLTSDEWRKAFIY